MSNSDKTAIVSLVALLYIADKYSGIEAKEYQYFINQVIDAYVPNNPVTDKELDNMRSQLQMIDDKISELNYQSSITLTLALGVMIAEYFLQFVRNGKKSAWQDLHTWCNGHSLIRHTLRSGLYDALDKSDIISAIIIKQ